MKLVAEQEIKELEGKALSITESAGGLEVKSEEDMEVAHGYLKGIKDLIKEVKATFDPICESNHKAWKVSLAARTTQQEPLEKAEKVIKGKIGGCMDICEKQRQEEEKKARGVAQKEQDRVLKAVKKRIETLIKKGGDIQENISTLKHELEDPELSPIEEAAITAQLEILEAEAEGNAEKVEQKTAEAVAPTYVAPIAVVTSRPKVKGLSSTVKKVGTVTNAMALVKAVAAGTIPISVIKFDIAAINKLLNAGMTLPGVSSKDDRTVTVR